MAKDGRLDHNRAMTGDDLGDFVNQELFPYLHGFKLKATGPNTIDYKIGEIFGGRDHSTVIHSLRKVEEGMAKDPAFKKQVDDARAELKGVSGG